MLLDNLFLDIGVIIVVATFFGLAARVYKQPLIPAYVLSGLLLGSIPYFAPDQHIITTLSEMGIAFLLFIVGLELDLSKLKSVGFCASLGGTIQCLAIFSLTFVLMLMSGFSSIESIYLGVILAFSSTMVVIKILSDKRELNTLHGRLVIGYLLVQDFIAILALSILGSINDLSVIVVVFAILKALFLCVIAWFANKFIFPSLFRFAASFSELLFLVAVSICFLFSFLSAWGLGFSVAIGAFIAGVSLANLPYGYEIIGRIKSIRDFFSTIFFVSLGMLIVGISPGLVKTLIILILITIVVKPLVLMFVTALFGYTKRPSFLTGVSLAQTSEFSLILATSGLVSGHISQELFSMVTLLAVFTMTLTSYFFKFEGILYSAMGGILNRLDGFNKNSHVNKVEKSEKYDVLLIGHDRIGYSIVKKLHILKKKLLVVDYNPDIVRQLTKQGIHCIYGDITDEEVFERINISKMTMVICTSPDTRANVMLVNRTKKKNKDAQVFLTAYDVEDALKLYQKGADYVILPHFLGGDHVSLIIEKFGVAEKKLVTHRYDHIEELKKRKKLGHTHPKHTHGKGEN